MADRGIYYIRSFKMNYERACICACAMHGNIIAF